MITIQRVLLSNDVEVECECEWEFERNPFDKETPHYRGEDDGWFLTSWKTNNHLDESQEMEVDDELNRQGPDI